MPQGMTDLVVDIMLPAYGSGELLREAIRSVLSQDCDNWRLTIIDDRADDVQTADFVQTLNDPRVTYLHNALTLGINRNFQRCVDEATGDLVVIFGSDDRLAADYVRTVSTAAEHFPAAAWFHPGVRIIDSHGDPVLPLADRIKRALRPRGTAAEEPGAQTLGGERLAASLLRGNWMYFPSCAFRREVLTKYGFRPGYDVVLDLDLYLRMLMDGHDAVLLDHVCFEYRRHALSLSSSEACNGDRFDEELRYFAEVRAQATARHWPRAARAAGRHATSRLHAATKLPTALQTGDVVLARRLIQHVAGRTSSGRSTTGRL